ncbi:MAG: CBS domain-containing protein [Elusimicrobia bacterium]|nr:CBS domain-containing protein [Elusimicrobiota bacterium]
MTTAGVICPDCGHANLPGEEDCSACHAPISVLSTPQPKQGMQAKILEGTVADLAPRPATIVGKDATVADAVKLMREQRSGCVLVTNGRALAGIFTERDLLLGSGPARDPSKTRLADLMRKDPDFLREDQPVAFAFNKMTAHGQHHVPVQRPNGSWALVSARDLLRYLCS